MISGNRDTHCGEKAISWQKLVYAGLLGNGLDLSQHVLHPFAPVVMDVVGPVMKLMKLCLR